MKLIFKPTLAFSQRKPGLAEGKTKSGSVSTTSIPRQQSNSSIDLTEDEPLVSGKEKVAKETVGKKDERKPLNPKSKEWAGAYNDAKAAMGNMEPSMFSVDCFLESKAGADEQFTPVPIHIIRFTVC